MRTITIIFWLLFWLFIYKLTFLEADTLETERNFTIYRDDEGIPHIYAKSYRDIFFGVGYAQAQDRLFALFIKKLLVEGRIGQFFGAEGALTDLEMRNIGFMEMAKANLQVTDRQTVELIQQYANGINSYAKSSKLLPMEFYLFWMDWQDWSVEDTLAYINFFSFNLEFDWFYEIARQRLLQTVGFDLGVKIITFGSRNLFRNTTILNDEELKEMGRFKEYDYDQQKDLLRKHWAESNISIGSVHFPEMELSVAGSGSNAWVIGGEHTKNGRPLLANDPHLASLIPSLFYCLEVVLLGENNQIVNKKFGVMADGIPSVSIGVGKEFAWGSTAAYIDTKDVYFETVRNNSGILQYLFKDEWHDFRERKELIKVRGGDDIEEIYYHTHRGVVISSIFLEMHWKYGFPLPQKYKNNHTITLNALHYQPDNSSARGHAELLTSKTFEEHLAATKRIQHPNIDSAFILKNGTFGYNSVGSIPIRDIPEMGSFIKDGNLDIYDMKGILKDEDEPYLENPSKGYLGFANNKFASDNYEFRSTLHEIVTGRAFRLEKFIKQKIAKREKFDFETMKDMQMDYKDEFVAEVMPKLIEKLEQLKYIWSSPKHEEILDYLKSWDYVMHKNSIQATFYQVWEYLFQHSLFKLVDLNEQEVHSIINHGFFENYQFVLLQKIGNNQLTDEQRPVCETLQTKKYPSLHPCEVITALAFKQLPNELYKLFSTQNFEEYVWGKIHQQHFKLIPFEKIPIINKIWQRNYPTGGNSRTLNVGILTHQSNTYNSIGTPVFRMITDLNQTFFTLQAGESDRVLSPFYDNFIGKTNYIEYVEHNPWKEPLRNGWTISIDTATK